MRLIRARGGDIEGARGTWYANDKDPTGRRRNVATKATTKTEARRLAADLDRQAERARFGLEPLPSDSTLTLGKLCTWWLDERCPAASVAIETQRLGKHVLRTSFGDAGGAHEPAPSALTRPRPRAPGFGPLGREGSLRSGMVLRRPRCAGPRDDRGAPGRNGGLRSLRPWAEAPGGLSSAPRAIRPG